MTLTLRSTLVRVIAVVVVYSEVVKHFHFIKNAKIILLSLERDSILFYWLVFIFNITWLLRQLQSFVSKIIAM